MRESNFAFPAQNKACVCITSQLYDRRALDTTSPLPLFNSLTHLTYLTSTSPRIREIMTMDGGLERLVRILHDFCMCPPPPENPTLLYGLGPPNSRPPKLTPQLNPHTFDKHAAYRFSLAFQCVVNIGVRGSEKIRSRVVQAGTLDVVGCILEAWLASKGFAVGPNSSATGLPRESREMRQARRLEQLRQRDEAAALRSSLQRTITAEPLNQRAQRDQLRQQARSGAGARASLAEGDSMDVTPAEGPSQGSANFIRDVGPSASGSDTDISADNSTAVTPLGSTTPTGSVVIPGRDRSGTIIARPVWDPQPTNGATATAPDTALAIAVAAPLPIPTPRRGREHRRDNPESSPSASATDISRPETETEDDGDGDVDMENANNRNNNDRLRPTNPDSDIASASASPSPERPPHPRISRNRRAVGIVSDAPDNAGLPVGNMNMMPIAGDAHIIINDVGGVADGTVGVEDGIVSLEPNDDFAMGAPPGAPGAMNVNVNVTEGATPRMLDLNIEAGRRRATISEAPDATPRAGVVGLPPTAAPAIPIPIAGPSVFVPPPPTLHQRNATIRGRGNTIVPEPPVAPMGTVPVPPPIASPAPTVTPMARRTSSTGTAHHHRDNESGPYRDEDVLLGLQLLAYLSKYPHVRQAFYKPRASFHPATGTLQTAGRYTQGLMAGHNQPPQRSTNVFSLVERFTFRPSTAEADLPNPPPRLPPEIQYWAGVIMRNACRKDENRGGIRQCANMLCGKWESYPREFAKCRRCRKAKYCGKECQSTAWSEGHRFWCSARDGEDENDHHHQGGSSLQGQQSQQDGEEPQAGPSNPTTSASRAERRERRERERERERERHGNSQHGHGNGNNVPGPSGGAGGAGAALGMITNPGPAGRAYPRLVAVASHGFHHHHHHHQSQQHRQQLPLQLMQQQQQQQRSAVPPAVPPNAPFIPLSTLAPDTMAMIAPTSSTSSTATVTPRPLGLLTSSLNPSTSAAPSPTSPTGSAPPSATSQTAPIMIPYPLSSSMTSAPAPTGMLSRTRGMEMRTRGQVLLPPMNDQPSQGQTQDVAAAPGNVVGRRLEAFRLSAMTPPGLPVEVSPFRAPSSGVSGPPPPSSSSSALPDAAGSMEDSDMLTV
ncbi:hypothetical protein AX16_005914 [Volvariella volvacea WC 439]|nr:hypothetical protein AX16_005914 [Volvariella volvacea WC 439]